MVLALVSAAFGADVHVRVQGGEELIDEEASWPAVETFTKKYGPYEHKGVSSLWSITAQPSVFDPLSGTYQMVVTGCVQWQKRGKGDKHCEKFEMAAGASEAVLVTRSFKGAHGGAFTWTVSAWYSGDAPAIGLPAPEPRPIPGE